MVRRNSALVAMSAAAARKSFAELVRTATTNTALTRLAVKFPTDTLPPILNALDAENGGNKLVLEVAVRLRETSAGGSRNRESWR
jgi:F-type H+-transporting ATPase subunit beta